MCSGLSLCVLVYGSFEHVLLREQTLSFHIYSHIIFNQTKATSEEYTHVNHTFQEDRAEEIQGGSVTDMSLYETKLIQYYLIQR